MRVEDSKYKDLYQMKVSFVFGNFYFFEKYIIGEISEGVHFDWEMAQDVVNSGYEHYGSESKVAYISNRINTYTVSFSEWFKIFSEKHNLDAIAIVSTNNSNLVSKLVQKIFTNARFRKFNNLDSAIKWIDSNSAVNQAM